MNLYLLSLAMGAMLSGGLMFSSHVFNHANGQFSSSANVTTTASADANAKTDQNVQKHVQRLSGNNIDAVVDTTANVALPVKNDLNVKTQEKEKIGSVQTMDSKVSNGSLSANGSANANASVSSSNAIDAQTNTNAGFAASVEHILNLR